jgi:hypothetical protein
MSSKPAGVLQDTAILPLENYSTFLGSVLFAWYAIILLLPFSGTTQNLKVYVPTFEL